MTEPGRALAGRTCAWCSAHAPADATKCPACGAALAQYEAIGDVSIPGVTTVDPALQAYDAQPLRIRAASPSQGMAAGVIGAAVAGGPMGLAVLGGLAAVAATEYLGARQGAASDPVDLEALGRPSGYALQALERLEREGKTESPQPDDAEIGPGDRRS